MPLWYAHTRTLLLHVLPGGYVLCRRSTPHRSRASSRAGAMAMVVVSVVPYDQSVLDRHDGAFNPHRHARICDALHGDAPGDHRLLGSCVVRQRLLRPASVRRQPWAKLWASIAIRSCWLAIVGVGQGVQNADTSVKVVRAETAGALGATIYWTRRPNGTGAVHTSCAIF